MKLFKKLIVIGLIIFLSTFLEIYWSVGKFSESTSSGCLDCSFTKDAFLLALLTAFFLTLIFSLLSLLKNSYLRVTIKLIVLILVWLFWNYTIFVDRESSWSTYTFQEEVYYTLWVSILPILTLSTVALFSINYILKSYESK